MVYNTRALLTDYVAIIGIIIIIAALGLIAGFLNP
jgi:hypothetical protein